MIREDIIIEDTTLRDGEQAPGIAFNKKAKLEIYRALVNAGIKWMEIGIPAMGGQELESLKAIQSENQGTDVNIFAWNRGVKDDVSQSIKLGFKHIHIGLPTSDIHLKDSVKKDRVWLVKQAADLVKLAKDAGCFVSISAEDVGRSEVTFLQEYAGIVAEAGADRLRLSDTIGILLPHQYKNIVQAITAVSKIDLQCHTHNDFGLAVANTLAGLEGGARYFHVTVNGIGERAGMPDLSQVLLALKLLYKRDLNVKLDKLSELSNLIAKFTGVKSYPWHPIIGDNVFSHESGIHANGTLKNGKTFEPFSPELINGNRKIVIGKHSGRNAIKHVLNDQGINVDESKLSACLDLVREYSMKNLRALETPEVIEIYRGI